MAPRAISGDPAAMPPDGSIAELLPRVYRRVLDAVDALERLGGRADAARLREQAIVTYSRSWDARCQRRLEELAVRAELLAGERERRGPVAA
jgi:hypothetical protein